MVSVIELSSERDLERLISTGNYEFDKFENE